ncbi:MAG: hypothetical protein KC933_24335, partial [Myxococcales bacterium]|nr:hypothetical protein [Myxococcales bacterium]
MLCLAPIVALASLGAPSVGMEPLPWRVAEEAVLDRGAAGMGDAKVVFAGDGAPRVALSTFGNAQPAMRLAVRGPDGSWRVVPIPAGVVGSGSPDISLAWPEGPGGPWRRAVLEGAGFTPAEAIDLP